MNADLEKIQKEVDLKSLETLLQNITFAYLDRDDLERLGDAPFVKLFRLAQYSIEYLLYTQNYLESLCKTLDVEYRSAYERALKTEEAAKKLQAELKVLRKELKLKQKTLSTYEYLMKLPAEQEQEAVKCFHCAKFFLSRDYLARHYQRHHPDADFGRLFKADLNDRDEQSQTQREQKINQEELFNKIKGELFSNLSESFKKIEGEISALKERQNFRQIEELLKDYEHKNEEEQRKIQDQLQKPARLLEELKGKWAEMFQQQTSTMKELVAQSVGEALVRRKEERKKNTSKTAELSEVVQDQKIKFFEQRINEFEDKFRENESVKAALQEKLHEYERLVSEKAEAEAQLQQRLKDEEAKRKEEERLRKEKEQELLAALSAKE